MADQIFSVNSGFYNAVNNDRTYSAEDMNRPYKRIVANGVFATPAGTASNDIQVTATSGMVISVAAGEGIFADKWFENPAAILITVPDNTNILGRIDSVIVQIDTTNAGRVGNIVYRTGTPASTPTPPAINQTAGKIEYRIANVSVSASATAISNSNITDLRGSSACPWVTALIQQVDTSTLYEQWQSAYANYYAETTEDFDEYKAARKADWDAFFESLTEELTVATNVITLTNSYTTTASTSVIPINIASFDPDADILQVFINGLLANSSRYTLSADHQSINLTNAIAAGQTVSFIVFKSVIANGDIPTITAMIEQIEIDVGALKNDSGAITLPLSGTAVAYDVANTPQYRKIGGRVNIAGAIKGITAAGVTIATLPSGFRPAIDHIFTTSACLAGTFRNVVVKVAAAGDISILATSGTINADALISLATDYLSA